MKCTTITGIQKKGRFEITSMKHTGGETGENLWDTVLQVLRIRDGVPTCGLHDSVFDWVFPVNFIGDRVDSGFPYRFPVVFTERPKNAFPSAFPLVFEP